VELKQLMTTEPKVLSVDRPLSVAAESKEGHELSNDIDNKHSHKKATNFKDCIRNFNSSLATGGLQAQLDHMENNRGPFCYRIHGQVKYSTTKNIRDLIYFFNTL